MTSRETTPVVSCIVPVYNGSRFIADALRSIRAQSHPRLEIIVIDDGSTDGTHEIVKTVDSSIRCIRQANQGPAVARNAGVTLATGSYIAFLDADDVWAPNKLERQLDRFGERSDLEVSFTRMRNVSAEPLIESDPLLDANAWPVTPFSPCTLLARRGIFDRVGPFDPALRHGEDTEWFIRMMFLGVTYEVLPDILVERRIHSGNLTREQPPTPQVLVAYLKLALDRCRSERR
jgi:glycosyltransferase involved in cell wall biosynthesis